MAARTLPPGPPGRFPLGNMRAFSRDTLSLLLEARRYGDFVTIHFGPYIGFIASHPDLMHQILVTDADKFNKPAITKQVMEPVVGKGLFTNEGESWKRQRRLTQPAFHTKRIGAYADVMVKHTLRRIAAWTPGSTQPIDQEMAELTMGIIAETLFNAEVGPEADAIGAAVTTVLSIMNERFNRLIPTPNWRPSWRLCLDPPCWKTCGCIFWLKRSARLGRKPRPSSPSGDCSRSFRGAGWRGRGLFPICCWPPGSRASRPNHGWRRWWPICPLPTSGAGPWKRSPRFIRPGVRNGAAACSRLCARIGAEAISTRTCPKRRGA
jgi:hypothetical protein